MSSKLLLTGVLVLGMALVACTPESVDTASTADTAETQTQGDILPDQQPTTATATNKQENKNSAAQTGDKSNTSSSEAPLFESPDFKTGGDIVPGHYACQEMPGMQLKSLSEMGSFQRSTTRWTSQFDITANGDYTYRGSTPQPGKYRYNQSSGTITWTTGPYSSAPDEEDTITGIYTTRRSDDHPVILLVFKSPAYGESCEYCALVPKE